jgi:uncharacterized protein YndB with AHSA1/START domain
MPVSSGTATVTLTSDTEILITREFDAPRNLVYKAWTTPELVRRWWSGGQGEMKVVEIDLRVGGRWRYVMESEGQEIAFSGEFHEIVENELLVHTEMYEAMPGNSVIDVVTFTDAGGGTKLELLVQCDSKETRDGLMASGMEIGMQKQYDLLDELAASLR